MFNDKYGLTTAVLQRLKTKTRRSCKDRATNELILAADVESYRYYPEENLVEFLMRDGSVKVSVPPYKIGEVVAVAQSYNDAGKEAEFETHDEALAIILLGKQMEKGWTNKMFVCADLMPHQIRILDFNVERLQDISEDDCLKEGIYVSDTFTKYGIRNGYSPQCANDPKEKKWWFNSPREAFSHLIDKVSGKGTWDLNPWNFAYEFELVK